MKRDERGREVRRRPPPGADDPRDLDPGFPELEHNQWTFEGEIERLGAFARGTSRHNGLTRVAAVILLVAFGVPFLWMFVSLVWQILFGSF